LMPLGFKHVISFFIVKNNLDIQQLTHEWNCKKKTSH
jgi:hypothetical protein